MFVVYFLVKQKVSTSNSQISHGHGQTQTHTHTRKGNLTCTIFFFSLYSGFLLFSSSFVKKNLPIWYRKRRRNRKDEKNQLNRTSSSWTVIIAIIIITVALPCRVFLPCLLGLQWFLYTTTRSLFFTDWKLSSLFFMFFTLLSLFYNITCISTHEYMEKEEEEEISLGWV